MIQRLLPSLLIMICMISFHTLSAQDKWDLRTCIEYAKVHNINIQQGELRKDLAEVNLKQYQHNRYPNLNGNINLGNSYGRTIDPTTNTFRNSTLGFNSFNLNSGLNLFSGGRVHYQIKQGKLEIAAADLDVDEISNNISLMIAQAYINVLFGLENYKNAKANLDLTQNQLEQLGKFINAGVRPENDKLEAEAQVAQNQQAIVVAQNSIDLAYINLRQLLMLPDTFNFEIEQPDFKATGDFVEKLPQLDQVYDKAMQNQPQIKAAEIRLESSKINEKISKSAYWPSLGMSAGLSSNYSSVNSLFTQGPVVYTDPQDVLINGMPISVQFAQPSTIVSKYPYWDQINDNIGYNVGFGLQVPILNNRQTMSGVQRAKIATETAALDQALKNQTLYFDISTALADATAAAKSLDASMLSLKATEATMKDQEKRFNAGTGNLFDMNAARSRFQVAQQNLLIAKYDYLFKRKVLDFYYGLALDIH